MMHRYLNLLTTDGGSVHHLLCLVGLLLRAVGDEGVPGGIESDEGERGGGGLEFTIQEEVAGRRSNTDKILGEGEIRKSRGAREDI